MSLCTEERLKIKKVHTKEKRTTLETIIFCLLRKTRSIRLVSFHSTYEFLYPLFYAFKQEV